MRICRLIMKLAPAKPPPHDRDHGDLAVGAMARTPGTRPAANRMPWWASPRPKSLTVRHMTTNAAKSACPGTPSYPKNHSGPSPPIGPTDPAPPDCHGCDNQHILLYWLPQRRQTNGPTQLPAGHQTPGRPRPRPAPRSWPAAALLGSPLSGGRPLGALGADRPSRCLIPRSWAGANFRILYIGYIAYFNSREDRETEH